jgi:hypothetical protein
MSNWDQDFVDAEVEGYVRFDKTGRGEFHFGYVHGYMDVELADSDGPPAVEWSWEGNDEMEPASGRGSARLRDDATLQGKLFFHSGDRTTFTAVLQPPIEDDDAMPSVDADRYRTLRAVASRHQNAAVAKVSKTAMNRGATDMGLLDGKTMLLETDQELTILFDHLIYDRVSRGKTPMQRYLDKLPETDDADEALVRGGMSRQVLTLFEIEKVEHGTGLLGRDLLRDRTHFVVDELLSISASPGQTLVLRLLDLGDWFIASGAGFPITSELAAELRELPVPDPETPKDREALAAKIIAAGFESGCTGAVEFR